MPKPEEPGNNKLKPPALKPFSARELKPSGWLRRQLRIQADGLSGNLDKVWPVIGDARWIGGSRDGWENVPYWLDGFIPLAWLLDEDDLKKRGLFYIDHIIANQKEDGWLCPCADEERGRYDIWAFFLICKVLTVYADCSADYARVEKALSAALGCIARHIRGNTLFNWASSRWFECLIPIFWLYERRGGEWLLVLARHLQMQGMDYEKLFSGYLDTEPERIWTHWTHVVNLAMCLKSGALMSRISGGDPDAFALKAQETLFKYHGTAAGHFSGDECLSGTSPIQGTELCGVVEAMYSYETLLSVSGNPRWGDSLERLAFNALPAAMSPDMWTHQYDQMGNQVQCSYLPEDRVIFGTNSREAHLFGLEPNFGCCTANHNQGWPKFALSAFMRSDDGIASTALVPSELSCRVKDVPVRCRLETEYPFREKLVYTIEAGAPVRFALRIRIPSWAARAEVEGAAAEPGTFFVLEREWRGSSRINVSLHFEAELVKRPQDRRFLSRGPLVFCVAPRERWEKREFVRDRVERKFPYCDYEIFPESEWRFGFVSADSPVEPVERPLPERPFSPEAPAIALRTSLRPVEWKFEHGVCEAYPEGRAAGPPQTLTLIPYGCTNLRVTEMPLAR